MPVLRVRCGLLSVLAVDAAWGVKHSPRCHRGTHKHQSQRLKGWQGGPPSYRPDKIGPCCQMRANDRKAVRFVCLT
ncbi:hypothetical protein SUDANB140_07565 (plasmid) [Streptomyces sp. enrichment culture]